METTQPFERVGDVLQEPSRVFLVHGRDRSIQQPMFDLLRAYGLHPIDWDEALSLTGEPNPFIGDILDAAFAHATAIVVLFTPDESVVLREGMVISGDSPSDLQETGQARPNVLFEAGMAMGRDPARTVLIEAGRLRPFSDIAGRHVLRFDGSLARRKDLARRLAAAGCRVNLRSQKWKTIQFPESTRPDAVDDEPVGSGITVHLKPSSSRGRAYLVVENHGPSSFEDVSTKFDADQDILFFPAAEPLPYLVPGQRVTIPIVALRDLPPFLPVMVKGQTAAGKTFTHRIDLEVGSIGASS